MADRILVNLTRVMDIVSLCNGRRVIALHTIAAKTMHPGYAAREKVNSVRVDSSSPDTSLTPQQWPFVDWIPRHRSKFV